MRQPASPLEIVGRAETETGPDNGPFPARVPFEDARAAGPDVWVYRAGLLILGVVCIVTVTGGLVLAWPGKEIPESIVALGSAAVGAIAGLLVPSPAKRG